MTAVVVIWLAMAVFSVVVLLLDCEPDEPPAPVLLVLCVGTAFAPLVTAVYAVVVVRLAWSAVWHRARTSEDDR